MSTTDSERADAPIAKFDFVNGQSGARLDSRQPQPRNHALAQRGAVGIGGAVLVNSRSLVTATLTAPTVFSSADLIEQGNTRPLIPLGIDPPDHKRYRAILNPLFAQNRMDARADDIAERVNTFIDSFIDRGSCDFTAEFAELFPASVFLGLMGLPWAELDTLVRLRDGLLHPGTPESTPQQRNEIQRDTAQQVYAYFDAILDDRAAGPREDILSYLAGLESDGEQRLTRGEALSICFVLLTAGLDTVTDSLTCFWAYLAQHPSQRRELAEDPDIIPRAVEELLRWETPVPLVVRWAREDSRLGEQTVAAGHHVVVNLSAANLDPNDFPDPLEVRFDRRGNRHLAFGGGVHRCLGSHLARRELRVALREWHRRIPEYTLAPRIPGALPAAAALRPRPAADLASGAAMTRVVQWATGTTGRLALRAVIDAPDLELVGVRVYDPDKVDIDAGQLAGRPPTGVPATDRMPDIAALEADVVLYMAAVERDPDRCFADVVELLGHGADVIATGSSFIDVGAFDEVRAKAIRDACRKGRSTFLGLGLFPGFWGEAVVPVLSRLSLRHGEITVRESLSYAGYPSRRMLVDVMGYGYPPDSAAAVLGDPKRAGSAFVGTASVIAKALGLTIESLQPFRQTAVTDRDLNVAAGSIPAGTVAAMKLGVRADCGATAIVVEHVTWLDPAVALDWSRNQGYEIEFDGAPSLRCTLVLGIKGEDHTEMGCLATAMHAVHAIAPVRAAPPGMLDLADLPTFGPGAR